MTTNVDNPDLIDRISSRTTPTDQLEVWEMQVPGMVVLNVLQTNRFGNAVEEKLSIGPNRIGYRFRISTDDRRENQRLVVDKRQDPFLNGMLTRVDSDQQTDPETASVNALTSEQAIDILDLPEDAFRAKVASLGEVPVRKIADMAVSAGASFTKVEWLKSHIGSRFTSTSAQGDEDTWPAETLGGDVQRDKG